MGESPEQEEAFAKLDQEIDEAGWNALDNEANRELNLRARSFGRLGGPLTGYGLRRLFRRRKGDPSPEPVDDRND